MRLFVIMQHFVQVFARHVQQIRDIVVAGSQYDLARAIQPGATQPVGGMNFERIVLAGDAVHPLVLADVEMKMIGHAAVVFQRFSAGWAFR